MNNLSFWTPHPDTQAPDIIYKDGVELHDDALRQEVVSKICETVNHPRVAVFSQWYSVDAYYKYPSFALEIIPIEADPANRRISPIAIYGEFPDSPSPEWADEICAEIETFVVETLGKTLHPSTLPFAHDWLLKYSAKSATRLNCSQVALNALVLSFGSLFITTLALYLIAGRAAAASW